MDAFLRLSVGDPLGKNTCEQLKESAFNSHPTCWTQLPNSFCFLPLSDVVKVVETVKLRDLFSELTIKQMITIGEICIQQRKGFEIDELNHVIFDDGVIL